MILDWTHFRVCPICKENGYNAIGIGFYCNQVRVQL